MPYFPVIPTFFVLLAWRRQGKTVTEVGKDRGTLGNIGIATESPHIFTSNQPICNVIILDEISPPSFVFVQLQSSLILQLGTVNFYKIKSLGHYWAPAVNFSLVTNAEILRQPKSGSI